MNKELWGKTTDLPCLTSQQHLEKKKKKFRQSAGCIIQSTQPCMNLGAFLSTFHFSLFPVFFSILLSTLWLCCLFSPLHIFHFPSPPCFFFSFIFSSLSALVLKGGPEALGAQRHGTRAHTKTRTHSDAARTQQQHTRRYAESFLPPTSVTATPKTSCRFSADLIDACGSGGWRCSRNVCARALVAQSPEDASGVGLGGDRCQSATTSPRLAGSYRRRW